MTLVGIAYAFCVCLLTLCVLGALLSSPVERTPPYAGPHQ